jgi:hypothetical protein
MPDKKEILNSIEDRMYNPKEVRHLVNSVKSDKGYMAQTQPISIKVGDVFISQGGAKKRPFVVISVRKKLGVVISVPLTTTNDELALTPYTSRFFNSGWFSSQLITLKIDYVRENFAGVLENREAIREVKKDLKKFYKGLL